MANIINLIENGSLANNMDGWNTSGNYSYSSNGEYSTLVCNITAPGTYPTYQAIESISGQFEDTRQIIYITATVRAPTTNTSYPRVYVSEYINGSSIVNYYNMTCESDGQWHTLTAMLQTYNDTNDNYYEYVRIAFGIYDSTNGDTMDIKNVGIYNLTEIFGRGNEPTKAWCDKNLKANNFYLEYMPNTSLIYDRTQLDITNKTAKGYYNYNDLNRIEEWCDYIALELTNSGYEVNISTKKSWSMRDFPTATEMNRIRSNVKKIKDAYYSFTSVPSNVNLMTYDKANQIEKVLHEISTLFNNMRNWFVYSGVAKAGQSRVWQNRFRKYSDMFTTTWNELTEVYWNDFKENETWEGAIINV